MFVYFLCKKRLELTSLAELKHFLKVKIYHFLGFRDIPKLILPVMYVKNDLSFHIHMMEHVTNYTHALSFCLDKVIIFWDKIMSWTKCFSNFDPSSVACQNGSCVNNDLSFQIQMMECVTD